MDVRSGGTLNLFLNTTEGVMADEKVRQAALAALNCDDILMASYGDADLYKLNAGWCNPDDAQWGTEAGSEYYNQNDVEKAKKLLSESSYNNEKIVLVTTPEYNEMYNATLVVQEQLKQQDSMQKLKVTTSAHSCRTVQIRNSLVCILQVTATICFQFSYQYWIKDGQDWIVRK